MSAKPASWGHHVASCRLDGSAHGPGCPDYDSELSEGLDKLEALANKPNRD